MGVSVKRFTRSADKAVNELLRDTAWRVYARYEAHQQNGDAYVLAPRLPLGHPDAYFELYQPLVRTPGLFLEFAGLMDEGEITQDVWIDWIERYGVLGLDRDRLRFRVRLRGGPGEKFSGFVHEAQAANEALRLYKSGTDLQGLAMLVQRKLAAECYPQLYSKTKSGGYVLSQGFRSLLGAMWLQMAWLLTAPEDDIRRCEWCNDVIAYKQPVPPEDPGFKKNARGSYRTRVDKRFCDDNCRGKFYYHNKRTSNPMRGISA